MQASSAGCLVAELCLTLRLTDRGRKFPTSLRRDFPFRDFGWAVCRRGVAEVIWAVNVATFPNHFPDRFLGSERKCLQIRARGRDVRLLITKLRRSGWPSVANVMKHLYRCFVSVNYWAGGQFLAARGRH